MENVKKCDVGVIYDALMLEVFEKPIKGVLYVFTIHTHKLAKSKSEINLFHSHQIAFDFSAISLAYSQLEYNQFVFQAEFKD